MFYFFSNSTVREVYVYGFYKEITFWSSTYDNDMVEEISNPERILTGTVDFSFLVIYLLPVLLIALTYNIGGLERDAKFERLIAIQTGSLSKWLLLRFSFYVVLLFLTIIVLMFGVTLINRTSSTAVFDVIPLVGIVFFYMLY